MIDAAKIKQLREQTGISITDCQKALEQSKGDIEKAKEFLRTLGRDVSEKKSLRPAEQGIVEAYIHPNKKVGVLIELGCETDFVAKSADFQKLSHEICLQIAAMNPSYIKEQDIPEEFLANEKRIYTEQFADTGKPQEVIEKIVQGKLNKQKQEISLLSQSWIKDQTKTIKDLLSEYIVKLGENIVVKRIERYEV